MKSEFAEWFVAQHKSRDSSGMPNHTDQQLRARLKTPNGRANLDPTAGETT